MKKIIIALALTAPFAASGTTGFAQAVKVPAPAPAGPAALAAPSAVVLVGKTFVVKQTTDAQGHKKNNLVVPTTVVPGDALVLMQEYRNPGSKPNTNFVINLAIPGAVSFTGIEQPWALVSVDGGKSFGQLATLKAPKGDGTMRPAQPGDVTHVRWTFAQPIPAGGTGRVMYYGVVK
jgi:hypothetical protein